MIQAPKGTHDLLPADGERRALLESHAQRIFGAAGYRRIETPIFEATELFVRGVGGATDIVQKEMYTFDDGGGRSLTLRPEGTACTRGGRSCGPPSLGSASPRSRRSVWRRCSTCSTEVGPLSLCSTEVGPLSFSAGAG